MFGCQVAANNLPPSIYNWKEQVKELKVGLLRNLPIDFPLPDTPTVRQITDVTSMLADGVLGALCALFGVLYTIAGKTIDQHIHNIYPIMGDEYTQLGSSKNELEWHVEDGFHPARPNWVNLLCLRGDPEAKTKVARAQDLRLETDILHTLKEYRFNLAIDDSFKHETHSTHFITSVLNGSINDPQIVFDPAYTSCQSENEIIALNAVKFAAEQAQQQFILTNGDALIFDNRRVIHARTAYHPRMDGKDRWLKRALILENSAWSQSITNGVVSLGPISQS